MVEMKSFVVSSNTDFRLANLDSESITIKKIKAEKFEELIYPNEVRALIPNRRGLSYYFHPTSYLSFYGLEPETDREINHYIAHCEYNLLKISALENIVFTVYYE